MYKTKEHFKANTAKDTDKWANTICWWKTCDTVLLQSKQVDLELRLFSQRFTNFLFWKKISELWFIETFYFCICTVV